MDSPGANPGPGAMKNKDTYTSEQLSSAAFMIISGAVMCQKDTLLNAATEIEKEAKNGYYDDQEGSILLIKIVKYLRLRAETMSSGFIGI